jgi:formylglycine-generating enzyme required for sulfatase activity
MKRAASVVAIVLAACGGGGAGPAPPSGASVSARAVAPAERERERVLVPPGEVTFGAGDAAFAAEVALCVGARGDADKCRARLGHERPARRERLPAFAVDVREVTNAAYAACAAAGACAPIDFRACETLGVGDLTAAGVPEGHVLRAPNHPVVCVSEAEAEAYCRYRGGRLPTELEWERAAEGDDERVFPWGNDWRPAALNWGEYEDYGRVDGYAYTAPVGSYPAGAGPFGTLDQAGNVWEWTASRYETAPDKRVTRGGGYVATPAAFSTNHRAPQPEGRHAVNIGFRCVADAER